MSDGDLSWLSEFASAAQRTDRFTGSSEHAALLAAGLMGEAGSVVAELKKATREREAYPAFRRRMLEEIGDFLWYYVRLVSVVDADLLSQLRPTTPTGKAEGITPLTVFLHFGASVGNALAAVTSRTTERTELRSHLLGVWSNLVAVAHEAGVQLSDAAANNRRKTSSRWPTDKLYSDLFDDGFPEEEQLPRHLVVEFKEPSGGPKNAVILRCNGINFGDRLTDNIEDPDGYRFHDVFHFANAVHLGWSPVVRALLRCKRKSSWAKDEGQDGARASILEEAVAATVFSRAKQLNFFEGIDHIDFDLLKTVTEFVHGFEVESVPLWQWETAILDGYAVFRSLRRNRGGKVTLDLQHRALNYAPSK